jgi:hypothetical protein
MSKVEAGSDTSSEEEDEIGVEDRPEWDNQFMLFYPKLKKKDPSLYNKNTEKVLAIYSNHSSPPKVFKEDDVENEEKKAGGVKNEFSCLC